MRLKNISWLINLGLSKLDYVYHKFVWLFNCGMPVCFSCMLSHCFSTTFLNWKSLPIGAWWWKIIHPIDYKELKITSSCSRSPVFGFVLFPVGFDLCYFVSSWITVVTWHCYLYEMDGLHPQQYIELTLATASPIYLQYVWISLLLSFNFVEVCTSSTNSAWLKFYCPSARI